MFRKKEALKIKSKLLCISVAVLLTGIAGFMGVHQFKPNERCLEIIDNGATETAVRAATDEETFYEENKHELDINAKAAVLIDGYSGKLIYAQNPKKHLPPASVTKVMTLLLVMEACEKEIISLEDKVIISKKAASMGGSQMYMEAGEQHTVEELLKGVIMVSANDGCIALAEHVSGSVESFVSEMNDRAEEMGLTDSNFVNTNGLPVADHYSCAYDIGKISAELMRYESCRKWFVAWQEDIKVGLPGKQKNFTLTNTNKLIKEYEGTVGIKTGFTQDAGYCLSAAAERDGSIFIGVVLGCESSEIRFEEMCRLLDYGFANYKTINVAEKNQKLKKISIEKGSRENVFAVAENDIKITVNKNKQEKLKTNIEINNEIKLPLKKGDKVGAISIYEGKNRKMEYDLVSDRTVERAGFKKTYIRMMKKLI